MTKPKKRQTNEECDFMLTAFQEVIVKPLGQKLKDAQESGKLGIVIAQVHFSNTGVRIFPQFLNNEQGKKMIELFDSFELE